MAANKFATMIHRNTNKITFVLIYAVLEWILILLLLSNSLFSYLIIKFAQFFGLKPPCLWCTRIDHLFVDHQNGNKNFHIRDLLCEVHAKQISTLGYCSTHRKLSESREMCEDCFSSSPEFQEIRKRKETVGGNNGEISFNCSCYKTSSLGDILECAQKENLYDNHLQEGYGDSDKNISDFATDLCDDEKVLEDKNGCEMLSCKLEDNVSISVFVNEKEDEVLDVVENFEKERSILTMKDKSVQAYVEESISSEHLEFFLDYSGLRLVRVESIDSITEESQNEDHGNVKEQGLSADLAMNDRNRSFDDEVDLVLDVDINEEPKFAMEEDGDSPIFHAKDCHSLMEELEMANAAVQENSAHQDYGTDEAITIEQLKTALRAERKTLEDLYEELEEERSASAVAANQTMAMINRLQEEKAAMNMEAFQYQRMMEEQSEYDQEALQMLNQVVLRREKEKQELEKELEFCRKKLLEYETKEKTREGLKKSNGSSNRSGFFSSSCCSNSEESDGLSMDLNQEEADEEERSIESLADFDIEQQFEDVRAIEDFNKENGNRVDDLYERLQDTEADGEFIRLCVGSLRHGDKGFVLLREISQHLRNHADVRSRNSTDTRPII